MGSIDFPNAKAISDDAMVELQGRLVLQRDKGFYYNLSMSQFKKEFNG